MNAFSSSNADTLIGCYITYADCNETNKTLERTAGTGRTCILRVKNSLRDSTVQETTNRKGRFKAYLRKSCSFTVRRNSKRYCTKGKTDHRRSNAGELETKKDNDADQRLIYMPKLEGKTQYAHDAILNKENRSQWNIQTK